MHVLILGGRGCLGHMLVRHLASDRALAVSSTTRSGDAGGIPFDAATGAGGVRALFDRVGSVNWVVNCVGMLRCDIRDDDPRSVELGQAINGEFPRTLAAECSQRGMKLVHISTDAVFAPLAGTCTEGVEPSPADDYGRTKLDGEVVAGHVLNLRLSIVGPDPYHGLGLFEWLRGRPKGSTVPGFVDQIWVGATTVQVARLCGYLIKEGLFEEARSEGPVHHFCPMRPVTKWELVKCLAEAMKLDVIVEKTESGAPVARRLDTQYRALANRMGKYQDVDAGLRELVSVCPN